MSDITRLPGGWRRAMRNAATASEAVRNTILVNHPDWHAVYQQFLGDALPGEWAAAKTNGSGAAVSVASSQLTCTSGADNDGYAGQPIGLFWKGDWGIFFESEQAQDNVTSSKLEVGFTDAIADAGAVNVKATPTATADDFCVLCLDSDDNAEFDIISELDNAGTAAGAQDVFTVVAGSNFTTQFVAQNDVVSVRVGSAAGNIAVVGDGAMQGGDLMTPWVFSQTRTTASKILTVEYMICVGPNS